MSYVYVKAGGIMSFTHLQVRSGYSLFKSTITIEKLVERAKTLEYTSLALTDEEVLYGVIPFYKTCVKYGIKPVIGMVVHIPIDDGTIPLVLLAKNNRGYEQLIRISTHIQTGNECTQQFLREETDNLIGILSTERIELKKLFLERQFDAIQQFLMPIESLFQSTDFYLGVENYHQEMTTLLMHIKEFSTQSEYSFVALHDVRFLEAKDELSFDCLQAMKQNEKWNYSSRRKTFHEHHLRSKQEMKKAF